MKSFIKANKRGNAVISTICGITGVFVGAFLVFIVLYTSGAIVKKDASTSGTSYTEPVTQTTSQPEPETAKAGAPKSKVDYQSGALSELAGGSNAVANAIAKAAPAVVNIDTTAAMRVYGNGFTGNPFEYQVQEIPRGMGTGMIVTSDGMVLTNNHVINGAKSIKVTLSDKTHYDAEIIGTDPISDLAVLKIKTTGKHRTFPTVTLRNSENMRIGDWVIALGNPLGVGQTATTGILSARNRAISDSNVDLRNLLQTDAAINPGNSGGPLLNINGEVIGINTAIIRSAQGIGFAIPAETAHTVMDELIQHGRVSRPYLGIEMGDLNAPARDYLGLDSDVQGVIVGRVLAGAPAGKADIKGGDVIVKINGTPTPNTKELQSFIRSQKVNATVTISLLREGQEREVSVKLEEMPGSMFRR